MVGGLVADTRRGSILDFFSSISPDSATSLSLCRLWRTGRLCLYLHRRIPRNGGCSHPPLSAVCAPLRPVAQSPRAAPILAARVSRQAIMSALGPTGATGPDSADVDDALDDISLAVYQAAWRIHQHVAAGPTGPTGPAPHRPSRSHRWHTRPRNRP